MAQTLSQVAVGRYLERLAEMERDALELLWVETFDKPPPKGWSRLMLRRVLATEQQGRTFGFLSKAERRQLQEGLPGSAGPQPTDEAERGAAARSVTTLTSGTRLVREWHGRTYEVTVLEGGRAKLGGETYRSLSAVARAITGTHWSGPAFFGLTRRGAGGRAESPLHTGSALP